MDGIGRDPGAGRTIGTVRSPGTRSPAERVADGVVLVSGFAAVLVGAAVLLAAVLARPGGPGLLAVTPYLLGLVGSFGCSMVYNMAELGRLKAILRRWDHAAIFGLIAGTYTAIVSLSLSAAWSVPLLTLVWAGAAGGAGLKLFAAGRHERLGLVLYLALGWVGLVALPPLAAVLSREQLAALWFGGLCYTGGVGFYLGHRLRFHAALWHVAVLGASGAFYGLVLTLVRTGPG